MPKSTLTSKGQITIPKEVRDLMGLRVGDRLEFRVDGRGQILLQPEAQGPLGRLPGLLRHLAPGRPVTVEQMNEAVARRAAGRSGGRG
ncbi:MAG: AbrB/MazE/SpoVT family DNA-binding domain-containing protein [Acidobacteriota bacterium]|nr:AbrB/MazE/SpoVT family DNA-binding domain-containing protein [Acidobacteriota bacterium]